MIRLIATDIDGTLVKEAAPFLYPEFIRLVSRLLEKGYLFAAASGRACPSIRGMFAEVADDIIYIAENGAHVRYKGKDLSVVKMRRDYVEGIMKELRRYYGEGCDVVVSTPEGSLLESERPGFADYIRNNYKNNVTVTKDVLSVDADVIKIAARRPGSIRELGEKVLIPCWSGRVKACMAGEEWVDFMDASVDKGNALEMLFEYFGVKKEESIAFGDNANDIGLMHAAGCSFAVASAREEVKRAAGRICPSYEERGVYQVLNGLLESGRI